jgi:hypothetical protein
MAAKGTKESPFLNFTELKKSDAYYSGESAVREVEKRLDRKLTPQEKRVVKLEGFVDGYYLDSKGVLTRGIGQTGTYAKGDKSLSGFDAAFKSHIDRMKEREGMARYDSYTPNLQKELIQAEYRGDIGQSPNFRKLLNAAKTPQDYEKAATEFLRNDDYLNAKESGSGVAARMEAVANAVRQEGRPTGFQQIDRQMFNPFGSNAAYGFNKGGNVMNNKMNTIQVSAPRYSADELQERARRSMMHGNYDDRMEDYKYDREYQEDYPYLYPRNTGSYALPQQQAAQRMMGGGMGYAQGGTVNQAQSLASSNQSNSPGLSLAPAAPNQTAQGVASLGRGGDSTLVHMQPQEVAGLQQLAQANGTSLTTNPTTGLPEAFSLRNMFKSMLPIGAGFAANSIAPGMGSAIAAGALTGGTVAAMSGDDVLAGTLTGGLGGYSGAGLETALYGDASLTGMANQNPLGGMSGASPLPKVVDPATQIATTAPVSGPVNFSGGVSGAYDQIATNLSPDGIVPAGGFEVAKTLGSPVVSMGLGGLEVSDFYDDQVEFNDPRDKYDPYSKLNLNKDTGISTALAADTGLRLLAKGGFLEGSGDGMSDDIPAMIDGDQPAALSTGEYVVSADVVSGLGNGSSEAGAKRLHAMMDRVRKATTGRKAQATEINPNNYLPA